MKIVHIAPGVYPIPSRDKAAAIEEVIFQISNHLVELGCQVYIIDIKTTQSQRKGALAIFRETPNVPPPAKVGRFLSFFKSILFAIMSIPVLWHLLKSEEIDIIHTHYTYSAITAMIVSRLRGHTPVIYTSHNPNLLTFSSKENTFKNIVEMVAIKLSDCVIALTPMVKRKLISDFGIQPAKICCLYNGYDPSEIEQYLHKDSSNSKSNIILCVGRISIRKNQQTIVSAIPKVIARYPNVKFVFAGPIDESEYLKSMYKFIAKNHLSEWVEFTGEIPRDDLYKLYNKAIIFVFPTLAEMQPLVLIEAMAFGLPVIASKIEPIVDIANLKKDSIITVNPNDPNELDEAIILLLQDYSLRQSMSVKAKEIASTFSWEHTAKETLRLYKEIIRTSRPKAINRGER